MPKPVGCPLLSEAEVDVVSEGLAEDHDWLYVSFVHDGGLVARQEADFARVLEDGLPVPVGGPIDYPEVVVDEEGTVLAGGTEIQ